MAKSDTDESFDGYFNCESLSDRVLYIVEVEASPFSPISEESSLSRSKASCKHVLKDALTMDTVPAKLSKPCTPTDVLDSMRVEEEFIDEDNDLTEKDIIELAGDIVEQLDETELVPIKQEEEQPISAGKDNAYATRKSLSNEPEFSVDEMIKSLHSSTEATLLVLNKAIPEGLDVDAGPSGCNVTPKPAESMYSSMDEKTNTQTNTKRVIKETKVFVHSVILAAKSEFFKLLLSTSGMKETKEKEVRVEVEKGETENMMVLLRCFYNKCTLNDYKLATVFSVCSLAMQYCFDGLIDKCLDIFRGRAESLSNVDNINQIAAMVSKIQNELQQHKEKCHKVMKSCWPLLLKSFYPLDECLEKTPLKFFQLHLNSMCWFLEPSAQDRFNGEHGNLFVYAMQRWLKAHANLMVDDTFRGDVIVFVEKLLNVVKLKDLTGDFLTNIMSYEHSPFNIWPGYKDWYIRALQKYIYRLHFTSIAEKSFPVIKRHRALRFIRRENNAMDIFALKTPVILNGFEIGIYFRVRDDRKLYIFCKCKNINVNKTGFDESSLTFNLQGTLKLMTRDSVFLEKFPAAQSQWLHEWLTFSYKQSSMCLQMYAVCKLSTSVHALSKQCGFVCSFQMQQITPGIF